MRKKALAILEKAIEGKLDLKEFYDIWPSELNDNSFYDSVYENLESGIEHFPGNVFSMKPNYEVWHKMEEYYLLNVDKALITLEIDDTELLLYLREKIIQLKPSIGSIQDLIVMLLK